jgi:hypothetical protein
MTPEKDKMKQLYNIRIESPFIMTQRQLKEKFGIGFKVISVETEKDLYAPKIADVDSASEAMILTGYRALARAHHPDLGGDVETMVHLNRAKKEILDLLKTLKETI